ncbi:MAG TPA: lipid-A-disaccharide synthase [Pyrinomonadaceae bacterium]|nr:lipid-A-disaccharide synthase [Pyrinomonadaceae bacterium]
MAERSSKALRIMIVAGEPSGDAHAAALVRALRDEVGAPLEFFGSTGTLMRSVGVESIVKSDELAIVGLAEIAVALPKFWAAYRRLRRAALDGETDAVIFVDWPDFNLRLARALHRRGLKIIYYISPQLWAWRGYRVRNIRRDVDLLLTILPFEKEWYDERGVHHVEFVGHPLAGEVHAEYGREEFCRRNHLDTSRPIIALLPGSRRKEFQRILPPMLDAARVVQSQLPGAQFVIALAPNRDKDEAEELIGEAKLGGATLPDEMRVVQHATREALAAADAAAVTSGTATLEAALMLCPHVIVYKTSSLNWHTLGRLIDTEHYGLTNLIAGERLLTELMQDELGGERLAGELLDLLDEERNSKIRARLREVALSLGEGGASQRAARTILRTIEGWKKR